MDDVVTFKYNIVESPIKESYKVGADGIYFLPRLWKWH